MPSMIRTALVHLALVAGGVLFSLLLAEGALRLLTPGDNVQVTATLDIFRPHPTRGFALRPDIVRVLYWNGKKVWIRTDAEGRRIPAAPTFTRRAKSPRIVFCGDSYIFGNEEDAADTFVFRLADLLDREAINLGVGGYSTFQALDALREYADRSGPERIERVVLGFFLGNDFSDNIAPQEAIGVDAQGHLRLVDARGRLRPEERSPTSKRLRRFVYDSRVLSLIVLRLRTLRLNYQYHREGTGYGHLYDDRFYTDQIRRATRQALSRFQEYCDARGIELLVLIIPEKDQVYKPFPDEATRFKPNEVLTAILREEQVAYLDLLPIFLSRRDEEPFNMTPAGHLSVAGHRLVVAALHRALTDE